MSNTASLVWSPSCFGVAGMVRLKCSETPSSDWETLMAAAQAGDRRIPRSIPVVLPLDQLAIYAACRRHHEDSSRMPFWPFTKSGTPMIRRVRLDHGWRP